MLTGGLDIEGLLDAVADRVAAKLHARLAQDGAGCSVRPRLLTVEQAAVYLGRTKEALQHLITGGRLPVVRADRRVFLDVRDLDEWVEVNKATPV